MGVEPELIAQFVATGQVKLVFWPVLNHGNPSVYATTTAVCIGEQDPARFWPAKDYLFGRQSDLWGADRDFYVDVAVALGADQATFEACYDGDGVAKVQALDDVRRERGVFSQPTFDINGERLVGYQSVDNFAAAVAFLLDE